MPKAKDFTQQSLDAVRTVTGMKPVKPGELLAHDPELQRKYLEALKKETARKIKRKAGA